jgi:hypothetical protein
MSAPVEVGGRLLGLRVRELLHRPHDRPHALDAVQRALERRGQALLQVGEVGRVVRALQAGAQRLTAGAGGRGGHASR